MKRSQVFQKILMYNLLIVAVPIWIGGIIHFKTLTSLADKSDQIAQTTLRHVAGTIDERLHEMKNLTIQIMTNSRVQKFSAVRDGLLNIHVYDAYRILREFSQYRRLSTFCRDFFVLFPGSDTVLTSSGKFDAELFFSHVYLREGIGYPEWSNLLTSGRYNGRFLPAESNLVDQDGKRTPYLTYIREYSYMEAGNPDFVVAVIISKNSLMRLLTSMAGSGWTYVADDTGAIVGTSPSGAPVFESVAKNRRYTTLSYLSAFDSWTYHVFRQKDSVWASLEGMVLMVVGMTVVALLSGVVIAYMSARSNYRLIRSVTESIASYTGDDCLAISDELDYLRHTVLSTIEKDRFLQDRLALHGTQMRESFVSRLLQGYFGEIDDVRQGLEQHGIELLSERFLVAVLQVCVKDSVEKPHATEVSPIKHPVGEQLLQRAFAEHMVFVLELSDDILAVAVNIHPDTADSRILFGVRRVLVEIEQRIFESPDETVFTGIGGIHDGLEGLHLSYLDSREALRYARLRGDSSIVGYDEINTHEFEFYYTIDTQRKIINAVLAGDYGSAESLIDRVYSDNFQDHRLSLEAIEILLFELMGTAVRVRRKIDRYASVDYCGYFDAMRKSESAPEVFQSIKEIFRRICKNIDREKKSHNIELKHHIIEFIEENYTDSNFSQTMMADALSLTSSYLSHFFREQFGETMVDYVNCKRIDFARRIFAEDVEISIADVAAMVGCYSDKALIRIFKKYAGVTPGKFRDMNIPMEDRLRTAASG